MAWLQKRPQVALPTALYTIGLNKTILVAGLGNPGSEYELTRHNTGFHCVDNLVKNIEGFNDWINKKDLKSQLSIAQLGDKRVIAIKPTTFMNNSGQAVEAVINYYKIDPTNLIVIHDELDIDFGQIRTRVGGSDAGHNGIKSITELIGTDNYGRLRVGIGPKPDNINTSDFVLTKFIKKEADQLPALYRETNAILTEYIYSSNSLANETRSFLI